MLTQVYHKNGVEKMSNEKKEKKPILRFENVSKVFDYKTHSLRNINFEAEQGEFIFLCGRTGSGKSTFLRLITRELKPTSGKIIFNGRDIGSMLNWEIPYLRRQIGVIRQGEGMFLEGRTAAENLEFVMRATGHEEEVLRERALKAMGMVGLKHKVDCLPNELSIGERKRVEIARALVNNPKIIIADEPTSNLDGDLAWDIMSLFDDINRLGVTLLIVTHDKQIVNIMRRRVVTFSYGKILGDVKNGRYGDLI